MTVFNREETLGGRNDAPARENDRAQEASRGRRMGGRTQGVKRDGGGGAAGFAAELRIEA